MADDVAGKLPGWSTDYDYSRAFSGLFEREVAAETDRGVIIVAATLMDGALETMFRNVLVPVASGNDELFEGSAAPLGTFHARILLAHRMGLVSARTARELHLFRKMRNDCAHNLHGVSFDTTAMKNRTLELTRSQPTLIERMRKNGTVATTTRQEFIVVASWTLWVVNGRATLHERFEDRDDAWGLYGHPAAEAAMKAALAQAQRQRSDDNSPP